jgi:hypothetical protein
VSWPAKAGHPVEVGKIHDVSCQHVRFLTFFVMAGLAAFAEATAAE